MFGLFFLSANLAELPRVKPHALDERVSVRKPDGTRHDGGRQGSLARCCVWNRGERHMILHVYVCSQVCAVLPTSFVCATHPT